MTVELDVAKWSELDYIASEVNNLPVMSILKMLSQADAPMGGSLYRLCRFTPSKHELLYVPDLPC